MRTERVATNECVCDARRRECRSGEIVGNREASAVRLWLLFAVTRLRHRATPPLRPYSCKAVSHMTHHMSSGPLSVSHSHVHSRTPPPLSPHTHNAIPLPFPRPLLIPPPAPSDHRMGPWRLALRAPSIHGWPVEYLLISVELFMPSFAGPYWDRISGSAVPC